MARLVGWGTGGTRNLFGRPGRKGAKGGHGWLINRNHWSGQKGQFSAQLYAHTVGVCPASLKGLK